MKIAIYWAFLLMSICSHAQTDTNYFTNQAHAVEYAAAHDARILMVFGGSDWCRPCMKLKKEILDQEAFRSYTEGKVAVLYLDFPAKKKNKLSKEQTAQNEGLAELYNTSGSFPKILLMDRDFTKLTEIAYEGQACEEFITLLQ